MTSFFVRHSIDLRKKIRDVVDNQVVKSTKFNTQKTKVNNSDKKVPGATPLIHINQCHTDKQNSEKNEILIEKYQALWFSDYSCFEYKK